MTSSPYGEHDLAPDTRPFTSMGKQQVQERAEGTCRQHDGYPGPGLPPVFPGVDPDPEQGKDADDDQVDKDLKPGIGLEQRSGGGGPGRGQGSRRGPCPGCHRGFRAARRPRFRRCHRRCPERACPDRLTRTTGKSLLTRYLNDTFPEVWPFFHLLTRSQFSP